jgi:hypothetical protein
MQLIGREERQVMIETVGICPSVDDSLGPSAVIVSAAAPSIQRA